MTLPSNQYYPLKSSDVSFIEIGYIAPYIQKAAEIQNNPLERIKIATAAIIGSLHYMPWKLRGMDVMGIPIGGTAQAQMDGGILMYFERVSKSKVDNRFFVTDKERTFKIYGDARVKKN